MASVSRFVPATISLVVNSENHTLPTVIQVYAMYAMKLFVACVPCVLCADFGTSIFQS